MGTVYWKADESIRSKVYRVMEQYHNELFQYEIKLGIIMAMSADEEKNAISLHGYPVAAMIKIVALKDRVSKMYDAELLIDADLWKQSNDARQVAIIDHELSHIALKRKKPEKPKKGSKEAPDPVGEVIIDDIGRPALKIVKADYNVGDGFMKVIQRHQDASMETHNLNAAMTMVESALAEETTFEEYCQEVCEKVT